MTSGNFISIAVGDIIVNRPERQRRALTNLDVLADSISRLGLIHPIVVTRNLELVAGERRIEAVRSLGWSHIICQYLDELDPSVARAIELEENIKREKLEWLDEVKAVLEYHELRASENSDWTQELTAKALGFSLQSASERINVAREARNGNTMVASAQRLSTAIGIVRRAESRRDDEAMLALTKRPPTPGEPEPDSILVADFNEWAGNSDVEDDDWKLLATLAANLDRLCTESAHIMFWFSMH